MTRECKLLQLEPYGSGSDRSAVATWQRLVVAAPNTAAACSRQWLLKERGTALSCACAQLKAVGWSGGSHTWLRKRHAPNAVMWRRSARFGRSPAVHVASYCVQDGNGPWTLMQIQGNGPNHIDDRLDLDETFGSGLGCEVDRTNMGRSPSIRICMQNVDGGARVARKAMVQRMGPATASRVKAKITGWKCRPFTSLKLDFRYTLPTTKLVCTAATASWQGRGLSPKRPVPAPTPAPASHDLLQIELGNR